jgi:hypothetical protein
MANEMVVAPKKDVAFTQAFEPGDFQSAMKMAEFLSKSSLMPSALRGKAQDIMVIAMQGRELGWPLMRALNLINVIQGKAAITAQGLAGLVLESAACEHFTLVESDATKATYETKRRGAPHPVKMSYTIDQARNAGLTNKDNWKRMPAEMLRARCQAALARAVYPDVLAGLYTVDELRDTPQFSPPPQQQQQQAPAPDQVVVEPDPEGGPAPAQAAETVSDVTGEVLASQEAKPYREMSQEERVAYWEGEFRKAPTAVLLRAHGATLAQVEPTDSVVRGLVLPAYKARMAEVAK